MSILPFKVGPRDWDDREQKTFKDLHQFRMGYGRLCLYATGLSDEGWPFFTLYVETTGEVIMHICRGQNGHGYIIFGPTRKTSYVETIDELHRGYAMLEENYVARFYAKGK